MDSTTRIAEHAHLLHDVAGRPSLSRVLSSGDKAGLGSEDGGESSPETPLPSVGARRKSWAASTCVLAELTGAMHQMLVTEIAELRGDAQLLQLLRDSVDGNVATVFSSIRHAIPIEKVELPTAALEHARRLAQRGVTVNALVRAYRLGHKALLDAVLDEIRVSDMEPPLSIAVFRQISEVTFGYIDWITQQVVDTYQGEHDRWMENRNSLRVLRVHELLDGADLDVDEVTTAIRYPLRRTHVGVVVWRDEEDGRDDLTSMERFVDQLAEMVGARESALYISVDRMTGWAWIPLLSGDAADVVSRIRAFCVSRTSVPWIAVGNPLAECRGIPAFASAGARSPRGGDRVGLERAQGHRCKRPWLAAAALMGKTCLRAGVGRRCARPARVLHRKRRAAARYTPRLSLCGFKFQGCRRGTAPALQLGEVPRASRVRTSWPTDQRRSTRRRSRLASLSLVRRRGSYHSSLTRFGPPPENFGQRADSGASAASPEASHSRSRRRSAE